MSYPQPGSESSDWESSFSQILNRTKHNLNRINSRYAPGAAPSVLDTSILASRGVINNENVHQNSLLLDRFSKTDTFLQRPEQRAATSGGSSVDTSMLERIIRLEEQQRASDAANASKLASIESGIAAAISNADRSSQQLKDLEHKVMQLNSKLSTLNGFVELLQGENETKRSVIAKMDHWIRQGEIWREELDGKVETLTNLTKSLDRTRTEQRELMAEHATRYELEQLRDKMTVVTQQSVAASLSAWHDKIEQSVRNVERQIALVRIGMTDAGRGSVGNEALLTPDEVAAALANPLPSELLLKGTVAHEVLQMQTQLEEKLENRLQLFLKDKVDGSHSTLHKELHQQLHNLCAEMGLDYPEVELGVHFGDAEGVDMTGAKARENYRIRLLEARKRSDEEVQELSRNVHRVTTELATLQQRAAVDQAHSAGVVSNLERKVDECIAVCGQSVQSVADRSGKLENLVRDTELAIRESVASTRSELIERLSDMSREWSTERAGLDRRLVVNERIAEDCLDRIKLSQSAVESYFKASPEIKRFQRTAEVVAQMQVQLSGVQEEVRSTAASVHKLEANSATKNEHLELRERVGRMEPTVLEKLPDYMESTKRVVDLSVSMQSRLDKLDTLTTLHHNDIASTIAKVSAVDVMAVQLKGLTTVATEEVKRLSASLAEVDTVTRKDINYLRDLTGSISSRVVAVEGKVSVMNKTYAADTVTTNNALAKLSTIVEELQAHDATTQNTLVQLQWALEAEHRESGDQFALLRGRLDLMHQVQPQTDAEGKSIQIKFTTVGDSSNELDETGSSSAASSVPPARQTPSAGVASTYSATVAGQAYPPAAPAAASVSHAAPAAAALPSVPPVPVKSSTRGFSAFMTEPSMSSPEKSAVSSSAQSRGEWSPASPVGGPVATTKSTPASSGVKMNLSLPLSGVNKEDSVTKPATSSAAVDTFVPAQEYSYDDTAAQPAQHQDGGDEEDVRSVHSDHYSDEGPAAAEAAQENSWDASVEASPAGAGREANMSASRIPMQSAFDMSMPSYVSRINSSSEVNQSDFDYSYRQPGEPAASDAGSRASSKLSVGSDDSVDQLNSTVAGFVKHRDTVISGGQSPHASMVKQSEASRSFGSGTAPSVTYNPQAAEEDGSSSESDEEQDDEQSQHSDEDHDDEDGADQQPGGAASAAAAVNVSGSSRQDMREVAESDEGSSHHSSDEDDEDDDDEFDDEGEEDQSTLYTHSQSQSGTSGGGSYSQIDGPAAGRAAVPALSMLDNSWDRSNAQTSFTTAVTGNTPSKDMSGSSLSGSSHTSSGAGSGSGAAKKPLGFAIPTLNMTNLPTRVSDADDIPSYRSTGRDLSHYLPGNSGRQSSRDAGGSPAAAAPMSGQKATVAASAAATVASPSSRVIGASESSPHRAAEVSESTGGSVSDSSVSSSTNFTASSSSYLTISSASPVKATVPPPAVATAARATAAPSVAAAAPPAAAAAAPAPAKGKLDLSSVSKTASIKERLKERMNKNRTSDTASVTSSVQAADEVVSFEDLEDSKH